MTKVKSIKSKKISTINHMKVYSVKSDTGSEKMILEGYANTKNRADRYGDIPTAMPDRGYIYELGEYKQNPVILLDHENRVDHIIGKTIEIKEDNLGLFVKIEISGRDDEVGKIVRKLIEEKILKTLSIAGKFYFENTNNINQLTLAEIYEISLVAVPADPMAIVDKVEKAEKELDEKAKLENLHLAKQGLDKIINKFAKLDSETDEEKLSKALRKLKKLTGEV